MSQPIYQTGPNALNASYKYQPADVASRRMTPQSNDRYATGDYYTANTATTTASSPVAQHFEHTMTPLTNMRFNEQQILPSNNLGSRYVPQANAENSSSVTFSQPPTTGRQYTSSVYNQPSSMAGRYYSESSRVVGHEYGPERVVSVTSKVDSSKSRIVNERYIEHEIRVPKKVTREEIIEKTIVVPERILHEEIVEDVAKVRERIIEIARPMIVEKVVEVPEYEYIEKIIEVPEIVKQERICPVDRIVQEERIKEVSKIIPVEKIVEVPEIQYREVPVERVVMVDDWRDEVIVKEVPKTQYVDQPVPNVVQVEKCVEVERTIPVPVEAEITYEFRIPQIKPRYHKITYPVYLPRFIEVPVNLELLQNERLAECESYLEQIGRLSNSAASLCLIENLATSIMKADLVSAVAQPEQMQSIILNKWKQGTLNILPAATAVAC